MKKYDAVTIQNKRFLTGAFEWSLNVAAETVYEKEAEKMSQSRRNLTKATYHRNTYENTGRTRGGYVYGNAAPKVDFEPQETPGRREDFRQQLEEAPRRQSNEVRKNREKAHHMSAGYVFFLATALLAAGFILVSYIQLQAELTNLTKTAATKETELNNLKVLNDETYNRIINNVDLEEVRRIAVEELGMVYAQEGQVITYENETRDYMRKVSENN